MSENYCTEPVILTDETEEYSEATAIRHRRDTISTFEENQNVEQKVYQIGGNRYTVKSIFPCCAKATVKDKIRFLIASEIYKVS